MLYPQRLEGGHTMPYPLLPSLFFILSFVAEWCSAQELPPLQFRNAAPGIPIKPNTTLRILPVGDSITVGFLGDDLNSYREKLRNNLSGTRAELRHHDSTTASRRQQKC